MLLDLLDLNDLLALPTGREHRALAPVVNIQSVVGPVRISGSAELAHELILSLKLFLFWEIILPVLLKFWCILPRSIYTLLSNIGLNGDLPLRWGRLRLFSHGSPVVNLIKLGHELVKLRLSEALVVLGEFV